MSTLNQIKVKDKIYDLEDTQARKEIQEILNNIPSGGSADNWELIQEVNIEQECIKASYDVDLDGKPFELRKAIVIIKRVKDSLGKNLGIGIALNGKDPWNSSWVIMRGNGTNGYYFAMFEDIGNGQSISTDIKEHYNDAMGYTLGYQSNLSAYWHPDNTFFKENMVMNTLTFGSYDISLGVGTKAWLYGVRK